jgi:hypothetical protein
LLFGGGRLAVLRRKSMDFGVCLCLTSRACFRALLLSGLQRFLDLADAGFDSLQAITTGKCSRGQLAFEPWQIGARLGKLGFFGG